MTLTETEIDIDTRRLQDKTRLAISKVKALTNFALCRNRLLHLLYYQALPRRIDIKSACQNLESCLETSMELLDTVSEFCIENNQIDEATEIVKKWTFFWQTTVAHMTQLNVIVQLPNMDLACDLEMCAA